MTTRFILAVTDGAAQAYLEEDLQQGTVGVAAEAVGPTFPFAFPVDRGAIEELRWFLEDYPVDPEALFGSWGGTVRTRVKEWGARIFEDLLGVGAPAHEAYVRWRDSGGGAFWIASDDPAVLSLPWELLNDPRSALPVALADGGVHRCKALDVELRRMDLDPALRVLVVRSRPGDPVDRPEPSFLPALMERLPLLSEEVSIEVLRIPGLSALQARLVEARAEGKPFGLVHVEATAAVLARKGGPGAALRLESPEGDAHPVAAGDLASALIQGGVMAVCLHTLRSVAGPVVPWPEAVLACRLVGAGVPSVVALPMRLEPHAAADFTVSFYGALQRGRPVSRAVDEGRRQLDRSKDHPSLRGPTPVPHWLVPQHYASVDPVLAEPARWSPAAASLPGMLAAQRAREERVRISTVPPTDAQGAPTGRSDFVGRDAEMHGLDRLLRTERVAVLHGPRGIGKSALARAYARLRARLGGLDPEVPTCAYAFEAGAASDGVDGAVLALGRRLLGPAFGTEVKDATQRQGKVVAALRKRPCLIVWDGFEALQSRLPASPAMVPPTPGAVARLRAFVEQIRTMSGGAELLICSRDEEEDLIGPQVPRLALGGMMPPDHMLLCDRIMGALPGADSYRRDRALLDLVRFLDGHPLATRVLLPHLRWTEPAALLEALTGEGASTPSTYARVEDSSPALAAVARYAFERIPRVDRSRVVALTLFDGAGDPGLLGLFSRVAELPGRFHIPAWTLRIEDEGAAQVMEEALAQHEADRERMRGTEPNVWGRALGSASDAGLAQQVEGSRVFHVHPALLDYLRADWRAAAREGFDEEFALAHNAAIRALGALALWVGRQLGTPSETAALGRLRPVSGALGMAAAEALHRGMYGAALALFRPLQAFLEEQGRIVDAEAWRARFLCAVQPLDRDPPEPDSPEGALWSFLINSEARRAREAGDLVGAVVAYGRLRDMLEKASSAAALARLGTTYRSLGSIAFELNRLDDAERWYAQSLSVEEVLSNEPGVVECRRALGDLCETLGKLHEAYAHYEAVLKLELQLMSDAGTATAYTRLGAIALRQGELDRAHQWYRASLGIFEAGRDRAGMGVAHEGLGAVAEARGDLSAAETRYDQAAGTFRWLNRQGDLARVAIRLGEVRLRQNRGPEADQAFREAMDLAEMLEARGDLARCAAGIGHAARLRGERGEAEEAFGRALEIFEELEEWRQVGRVLQELGELAQLRGDTAEAEEMYRAVYDLQAKVGDDSVLAMACVQLGLVAEGRGELPAAVDWMVRAAMIFPRFPHPAAGPAPGHLSRLARAAGLDQVEASWSRCAGGPLPKDVRRYLAA